MKKIEIKLGSRSLRSFLFIVFFVRISTISAQKENINKSELLEDLKYIEDSLPVKHINLFAHISKMQFIDQIAQIRSKCDSLDYGHFQMELCKLIAKIGDEHTFVELNNNYLPIKFQKFKEGYFITSIDSVYKKYIFSKLLSIDGQSVFELENQLKNIIPIINPSYFNVSFLKYLNNPSVLYNMNLAYSDKKLNYKISIENEMKDVVIDNLNEHVFEDSIIRNKDFSIVAGVPFYWFGIDQKATILYFNYTQCRNYDHLSFDQFNNQLWDSILKYHPKKIIIDLRNNGGGNSAILEVFEEKLKNSYLDKSKQIYVLIGPTTFSSALMNAVELKRNTHCTLIGQPTSGNINHYGEVRGLILPNTKMVIGYSTRYWVNWKGMEGNLKPDVFITYSIHNFSKGLDEAIRYVYQQ